MRLVGSGGEPVIADTDTLRAALDSCAGTVRDALSGLLPQPSGPEAQLHEAMRYAVLSGGRRLRPFLVLETSGLFGVRHDRALRMAAAIECVHSYSLVHDDLPCMDDDAMRRGQPATHVRFGEGAALLAGSALLARAFEIVADESTHPDAHLRADLVRRLAAAAGGAGMMAGQMIDLALEPDALDDGSLSRLQRLKTGELILLSCEAGALMGGASNEELHALQAYAHDLGLAYQIAEDLLDAQDDAGKAASVTASARRERPSFARLLGPERAREQAGRLADQAGRHLAMFGESSACLAALPRFLADRQA
jgi:farnesyl diphosphate synthase